MRKSRVIKRRSAPIKSHPLLKLLLALPWAVLVLAAAITWYGFYAWLGLQGRLPLTLIHVESTHDLLRLSLWHPLLVFGEYGAPGVLLVMAVIVFYIKDSPRRLFDSTVISSSRAPLLDMNWGEFEVLVGEYFRRRGYMVCRSGGHGADGGVDLCLTRNGKSYVVQCKQWRTNKVAVEIVRELYGIMAANRSAGGFVVTSGDFTKAALEFVHGKSIYLISGDQLLSLMKTSRSGNYIFGRNSYRQKM